MLKQTLIITSGISFKARVFLEPVPRNLVKSRTLAQQDQVQQPTAWESAKPMHEIPSPPTQPIIGHLTLVSKHIKCQHKLHSEMHKKYGNIVRYSIMGEQMVALYGPEEISTMYANDGKYPVIGGFENFEFLRY